MQEFSRSLFSNFDCIGRYRNPSAPVSEHDFELAKQILSSFDQVLITEWLNRAKQVNMLCKYLIWFFCYREFFLYFLSSYIFYRMLDFNRSVICAESQQDQVFVLV